MPVDLQEEKSELDVTTEEMRDNTSSPSLQDIDPILRAFLSGHADADLNDHAENAPSISESLKALHPYAQTLTARDVESCVLLENATFAPELRASREKFLYRLGHASELSFGLFTSITNDSDSNACESEIPTITAAHPVDSNFPTRTCVLLGHVVATRTRNLTIQDDDMAIPDEDSKPGSVGHAEDGRTIAVHSLAVLPSYQKLGVGSILMKAYIQRIVQSDSADRISLLTFESLVPFYERLGFQNVGRASSTYGGEAWVDMVLELSELESGSDED